jgi:hypothetical protein
MHEFDVIPNKINLNSSDQYACNDSTSFYTSDCRFQTSFLEEIYQQFQVYFLVKEQRFKATNMLTS